MEKFLKGKNIGKYMGISIKDVNIASIFTDEVSLCFIES